MKPPFGYFGGKLSLAGEIVSLLPEHRHYVEPFAGSLAVLLAKQKSKLETVNDLNQDIINFWRVLREHPEELQRQCDLSPYSRIEYKTCCEPMEDLPDMERARRLWVRLQMGFARSGNGGWKIVRSSNTGAIASRVWNYSEQIPLAAQRIRDVQIECKDALILIEEFAPYDDVLMYVDPPYLGSTTNTRRDRYMTDMPGDEEHRELAELLNACKGNVILSGYDSDLYRELYKDWDRREINVRNTNTTSGERTEVLWLNYTVEDPQPSLFEEAS